ncbi:helix-turn-helix domain-containing protein [Cysteiniphilum halobium]|uniref:helix-turn-helix domain-containing protein n=1 Tax=Cysteiniphilum halobium TaxID=2219059 RepID=UPI000E659294
MELSIGRDDDEIRKLYIIGKNIRCLMHKKGINSVEISRALCMSTGTISKICNGKCNPSILILGPIANYLGVKVDDLLFDAKHQKGLFE